ncbi:MAG TPA: redoxin family protein [Chloroflexota bacterium]|nr:redoxin family protein [Chloroflexota bacterium]
MDTVLLLARLLLAAVFIVAGLTKLADLKGSRQAMRDFGVPTSLATPFGIVLPVTEIVVAIALIPRASAWWGALGALALLLLFVAGIGTNLARGRTPDCHCFGQLHSSPAGWPTLARNGALAVIAAFVVLQGWGDPGFSAVAWIGNLSTVERAMLVLGLVGLGLLAAQSWAITHLLGQHGRLLLRLDSLEERLASGPGVGEPPLVPPPTARQPGLPVGTPAPNFSLSGLHGETLTLGALRAAGKPVLLIFSDPGCGPCNALLPDIGRWQREHGDTITVALISRGTPEANRAKSAEHQLTSVLLQQDREVAEAYEASGTPSAVLVLAGGTIASPLAAGAEAIRALVTRTLGTPASVPSPSTAPTVLPVPSGSANGSSNGTVMAAAPVAPAQPGIGDPAPDLSFPDLDGKRVSFADFRGKSTIVLFWDPGCGFCSRMLDDLKTWEAESLPGAPTLLVVSKGDVETNRAMGLKSTVVLDGGFTAGNAFGTNGTPTAVLLDADGRVASPIVAGAQEVMALAKGDDPKSVAPAAYEAGTPLGPQVGDPAPPIKLPDLNGKTVDLAKLRGTQVLVLFWNPGCGFCNRMLDDLKAWEAKRPKGAPKLLIVSTGDPEANRAMGLRSLLVLDQGFSVGSAFGASGTPSAVLVDNKGNIASDIAVGAPAVLALAGGPQEAADRIG